jgi:hypothetical protein
MKPLLLGAAVLAFAACGSDQPKDEGPIDPVEPTDPKDPPTPEESARDYDELASVLAAHVRGEFALQLKAADISESRYPEGFSSTGSTPEETTGVGANGSMSYQFGFHCNDGTTAHLVVPCDGNAHHSHIRFTITGSQAVGAMSMDDITRVVDWEIRDITLDKARFRGPDQVSLATQVTTENETASYRVQFTAVYEQVRFLPSHTIPTAGTIDFTLNTERVRGADRRVFNTTAHLAYGASGAPTTLTIGGTNSYTINLTSGAVVKL